MFPVADGDTGDNMALTLRHVIDELDRLEQASVDGDPKRPEIVRAVARAALMGARGNSGVILSQIVRGAAEKLATPPGRLIDPEMIEAALTNAADAAWASVREPAEGTMLTVARAMAEAVQERRAHWNTHHLETEATADEQNALLAEMLAAALFAGEEALRHTPEQLEVLADAGVVDAGGLGLVVIVRGALAALAGESVTLPEIEHYAPARLSDVHHAESQYRYCINFIVLGEGLSTTAHMSALEEIGDSVLVVGDEATLKVHVHADDPGAARSIFDGIGSIEREDIADMREQIAEREARLRDTTTGVLAVVSGRGDAEALLGARRARDRRRADDEPLHERPPARASKRRGTDEVVVLPNSKNVHMAAEEAARLSEREVRVVPTVSQQGALAALVEHDPTATAEDNAARLTDALGYIRVGGVAPAAKDDPEGRFVRGDTVGFEEDEVVAFGGTGSTLAATVARLADGAEIVTVIEGEMPPIALDDLDLDLPDDVELELHRGGQPSWYWLIAAQ